MWCVGNENPNKKHQNKPDPRVGNGSLNKKRQQTKSIKVIYPRGPHIDIFGVLYISYLSILWPREGNGSINM